MIQERDEMAKKNDLPKFEDRVRFNWGFHDATADAEVKRLPMWHGKTHPDAVYVEGYEAGAAFFKEHGHRPESSEPAWVSRQEKRKVETERRKSVRAARPQQRQIRV